MDKIQRVSKFFKWLFIVITIISPILCAVFWIYPESVKVIINFIPDTITIMHPLSWGTKLLGFLVSLIPTSINIIIFYFLIRLFQYFEQGVIFALKNVIYIKRIGYMLLIGQLIQPLCQSLLSVILTWSNPPHNRVISISVSGTNIGLLLAALLIILISWIMAEGYKLKEEQEYTI